MHEVGGEAVCQQHAFIGECPAFRVVRGAGGDQAPVAELFDAGAEGAGGTVVLTGGEEGGGVETLGEAQAGHDALCEGAGGVGCFEIDHGRSGGVFEVFPEMGDVLPAVAGDVCGSRGPGGEPGFLPPIGEVVSAFDTGEGVVADFVSPVSRVGEDVSGRAHHFGVGVVVDGGEITAGESGGHGGAGFVGQRVCGDVFDGEVECVVEVPFPVVERLAGDGVDEVDADSGDAGISGECDRAGDGLGVVPAAECFEVRGIEGLGADADAVDAGVGECAHEFGGRGFGVALDGPFGPVGEVEDIGDMVEEASPEGDGQEGWGAAADKYRSQRAALGPGCDGLEVAGECVGEGIFPALVVDDAVEITVVAFVETEGDVDIERSGGAVGGEGVRCRSGCFALPREDISNMVLHVSRGRWCGPGVSL